MRKTHLSYCVSNRSGVLVRVGVRMDPMCLAEWEWGWIRRVWEGGNENWSNMVGRSEDGSGSVKVRISRGDTKPLKRSHPQPPASSLRPPISELRTKPNQNICKELFIPWLILTFTLPDPSSLLPTILDLFLFPPSQTRRIYPHSHPHKHAGSVRYAAWKVSFSHSRGKANNLI